MKKPITLILCLLLFNLSIAKGQEATESHKDSISKVLDRYYELNLIVFQPNSTSADIDKIFDLFTEDFTYVHPKYGGTYTRQVLYDGYIRNQKSGGYDGSVIDIKRENLILGLNAAVVEKRFITKRKDGQEEGKKEMTLFEFKDGKISRIFEYW